MRSIKFYSYLLIFLFIAGGIKVHAQKAKVKDEPVKFSYMRLPFHAGKEEFKTYSTAIIADEAVGQLGVNAAAHEDKLVLHGKQKHEGGGHFLLEVRIGAPQITSKKVDKQTKTTEDKDGKKTTRTSYKPSCNLSVPISYKLVDFENNYLIDETYPSSVSRLTPKEKSSESAAKKLLDEEIRSSIHKRISDAIIDFSNQASAQYGFQNIHVEERLYKLKSDKHPEFSKFQKSFESAQKTLSTLKPGVNLSSVKEALQPHIDYWAKLAGEIANDDKKAAKLKFASLYNSAQASIWTSQFATAQKFIDKLDELSKKDFLVSRLKNAHKAMSAQVQRYPERGMYFDYQIGEATPPESVSYEYEPSTVADMLNTSAIPKTSNQHIKRGQIHYLGQTHEAAFVLPLVDIDGAPQNFCPKDGFKIYTHDGNEFELLERVQVDLRAGDYFIIDDMKYKFFEI